MAIKKIQTRSFFNIGGRLVSPDDMNEEQRIYAATKLKEAYLNELFRGKAIFTAPPMPPWQEVFANFLQEDPPEAT